MSDPLMIAFVVEGPTDFIMLKEIVKKFLGGRDFVSQTLQPEMSEAFLLTPGEDGGWPGVCRWCLQAADQGEGRLSSNPLFISYDVLVFQLDADVASSTYAEGHIIPDPFPESTLPCEEPCPPPSATTNRLREIALKWMGEAATPPRTVFCIPSKALETWVLVGLFPNDGVVGREDLECRPNPSDTLQGKPLKRRLVSSGKKNVGKYKEFAQEFARNWGTVAARCIEARRFENEFVIALSQLKNQ
jgi:hypothetical protein